MPIHEYECDTCGHRFERIQKFSDPPIEVCPNCGGHVHKLISSPAIQFKGTGWYITDYAKKDSSGGKSESKEGGGAKDTATKDGKDSGKEAGKSSSSSDSGSGESKSSGKSESGSSSDSSPKT
jgi:putative FmdB family regulatory protein